MEPPSPFFVPHFSGQACLVPRVRLTGQAKENHVFKERDDNQLLFYRRSASKAAAAPPPSVQPVKRDRREMSRACRRGQRAPIMKEGLLLGFVAAIALVLGASAEIKELSGANEAIYFSK